MRGSSGHERQLHRLRAGGDDGAARSATVFVPAVGHRTARWCGSSEAADCRCTTVDLAHLRHRRRGRRSACRRPCPCSARSLARSIFGSPKSTPCVGEVRRLVDHRGDVQQRLRRDAADVEADAAERRVALDQHGLQAEVGGAERRRVAAGAGAEHEHVAFDVGACRRSGAAARRRRRRGRRRGGGRRRSGGGRRRGRGRRAAAAPRRAASSSRITEPFADLVADLDPQLLHRRRRADDGISIVALSRSSVIERLLDLRPCRRA